MKSGSEMKRPIGSCEASTRPVPGVANPRGFLVILCLAMAGFPALAGPRAPQADGSQQALVFKGCSIIRRAFMTEAARAYEEATGKRIDVMGGGATLGIRSAAAGGSDIGGACRPALPRMADEERGVHMTQIAWDALVFITHPSNPLNGIGLQQAKAVLMGDIDNWKPLGGPNRRILPMFRSQVPEHGGKLSGVGYMTRLLLFDDPTIDFTSKAVFFLHSAEVEEAVEKVPYSFGVTGVSSANKRNVKVLALDGVAPSQDHIASGAYPLFRPLYLMTRGEPRGSVKDFIAWLLSERGQRVVHEQGTVTLRQGAGLRKKFRYHPPGMEASAEP